jgi:hypothetical protein
LLEDQYSNPVRVVAFNTAEDWSRGVSDDVADELRGAVQRQWQDTGVTRGGHNWTSRFPWNVEAALKNPHRRFVLDGEAVIQGVDGISVFNALHAGKNNHEVQLYAFDVFAMDADDLRELPLSMRKAASPSCFAPPPGRHLSRQLWAG